MLNRSRLAIQLRTMHKHCYYRQNTLHAHTSDFFHETIQNLLVKKSKNINFICLYYYIVVITIFLEYFQCIILNFCSYRNDLRVTRCCLPIPLPWSSWMQMFKNHNKMNSECLQKVCWLCLIGICYCGLNF